jgi:type IV secretion system protein VirB6
VDAIWNSGGTVAGNLWTKGTSLGWSSLGFLVAATVVWCLMGLLCVYVMFLIALSNIALAVLLALGPLFIAMLFFEATKRMFSAWIAQLANYALISILTVMVAALLLQLVQSYAAQTAARGSAILTMDALNMLLIAVLVFLILRQIMPIAAGLAGGAALSTLGAVSRTIGWGMSSRRRAEQSTAYAAPHVKSAVRINPIRGLAAPFMPRKTRPGDPASTPSADIDPFLGG